MTRHPLPRTPIRPRSAKAARRQRQWAAVTREAIAAAGGRCAVNLPGCLTWATTGHHKLARRFGDDSLGNCLPVCAYCHAYVHAYPAWAVARGFIVRGGGDHAV